MKYKPMFTISFLLFVLSCKTEVYKPIKIENTMRVSTTARISVKTYGAKGDGLADDAKAIQQAIAANREIYFPKGNYLIKSFIEINQVSKLKITGESGAKITTGLNKIFNISGTIKSLEISNIYFVSVKKSSVNDPEGLINIANYGPADVMDSIVISNCNFSNPGTHANAIKLVSEGKNAVVKNIQIKNNHFEGIGRMGVEFQNHNRAPNIARFRDYQISDNYFHDVGTIQTGPAPVCISVSGYSVNGKINHNEILDMHMSSSSYIYYGIENAGTVGLETIGNHFKSISYGFTGILGSGPSAAESSATGQPIKSNWVIKDNLFELAGSSDKNKIRGMELWDLKSFTISGNTIRTDGMAIMFAGCNTGSISLNKATVKSGNAFYFKTGSTKNKIYQNTLDCSKATDNGVVLFDGASTSGNTASQNVLIKTGNLPGRYVNINGAINTTN